MKLNQMLTDKIEIVDEKQTVISVVELKLIIRETITENLHQIQKDNVNIVKLMNAVEAIGDGDIPHGAARIQENHRVMTNIRRRSDAIASTISNVIMMCIIGGLLSAVWIGIKKCIKL